MSWWEDYQLRRGVDRKTSYINDTKNLISIDFKNSTTYHQVRINGINKDVRIIDENSINKKPNKKRILSFPNDTFSIGQVVIWNSENWLITNIDSDTTVQTKGIIERCNNTLSFYNNHTLYNISCIISASGSSLGMSNDENKYITDISDAIIVRVPDNETSRLIEVNSIFKIGRRNYKVTNDSDIIENGLLIFKMEVVLEEPETHVFTLDITNGETISVQQGSTLKINTNIYDNSTLISPTPALTYLNSNETVCNVDASGLVTGLLSGSATITVAMTSDNTVQDNIVIDVIAEESHNYAVDISGATTITLNSSITLTAKVYDNGNVDTTKGVSWTVVNQDGTSNQYVSIVSQTANSITIKASSNSSYVNKYVVVRGMFAEDNTKFDEQLIQIKNLF